MQAFIQGVLNGARDFEQQPRCKAKRWRVSADAYQWERVSVDAYQWARVSADAYQWERVSVDSHQWERVSVDSYQWKRVCGRVSVGTLFVFPHCLSRRL